MSQDSTDGLNQISELVQSLKDFSRLDRAAEDRFDVREGIEKTLLITRNLLKYGVTVDQRFGEVPPILCAPSRINQVFINLVTNAVQAMDGKGTLTITTSARDGWVDIEVCDTGCGIAPENLSKIMDPFFTTKPVGQGTGLGLSIVRRIVDEHGGKIAVDSKVGVGTTITISLPIDRGVSTDAADRNPRCSTTRRRPEMEAAALKRGTVLFVDDERRVLTSMRAMFRRDYEVLLANSGQEAIDLLRDHSVDVIVSDQRMPGMTGVEVLKAVKTLAPNAMRILLDRLCRPEGDRSVDQRRRGVPLSDETVPERTAERSDRTRRRDCRQRRAVGAIGVGARDDRHRSSCRRNHRHRRLWRASSRRGRNRSLARRYVRLANTPAPLRKPQMAPRFSSPPGTRFNPPLTPILRRPPQTLRRERTRDAQQESLRHSRCRSAGVHARCRDGEGAGCGARRQPSAAPCAIARSRGRRAGERIRSA